MVGKTETTLGGRIAGRRRTLELHQATVAARVGVTQRHLSKLENNDGVPSWRVALKLADALDVSLDYLAGRAP